MNAVEIVERFWAEVWQAPQDPDAVDRLVTDDFVLTSAGVDIVSRAAFKQWVIDFLARVDGPEFEVVETFQNAEGTRVASRWVITGRNNGILGTEPDGQPIRLTGTAVWAVRADGLLEHNWVERSAFELYQALR